MWHGVMKGSGVAGRHSALPAQNLASHHGTPHGRCRNGKQCMQGVRG